MYGGVACTTKGQCLFCLSPSHAAKKRGTRADVLQLYIVGVDKEHCSKSLTTEPIRRLATCMEMLVTILPTCETLRG